MCVWGPLANSPFYSDKYVPVGLANICPNLKETDARRKNWNCGDKYMTQYMDDYRLLVLFFCSLRQTDGY